MTRFSVKAAEPDTELSDVIPTLDSDTAVAKAEPNTTTAEINEHPVTPTVTLRPPKSAIHDSSTVKEDDHSPKEVRFNFAANKDPLNSESESIHLSVNITMGACSYGKGVPM